MSKNKKSPTIFVSIFIAVVIAAIIIMYVGLKLEIERLTKQKILLEESLNAKKSRTTMLLVEIQKLEAAERIIPLAESRLNMIKFTEPNIIIEIDPEEVNQITRLINNKYE